MSAPNSPGDFKRVSDSKSQARIDIEDWALD